jgi:hypothetical protein
MSVIVRVPTISASGRAVDHAALRNIVSRSYNGTGDKPVLTGVHEGGRYVVVADQDSAAHLRFMLSAVGITNDIVSALPGTGLRRVAQSAPRMCGQPHVGCTPYHDPRTQEAAVQYLVGLFRLPG